MTVFLDGQTKARAQMGVNVVCPRHKRELQERYGDSRNAFIISVYFPLQS